MDDKVFPKAHIGEEPPSPQDGTKHKKSEKNLYARDDLTLEIYSRHVPMRMAWVRMIYCLP